MDEHEAKRKHPFDLHPLLESYIAQFQLQKIRVITWLCLPAILLIVWCFLAIIGLVPLIPYPFIVVPITLVSMWLWFSKLESYYSHLRELQSLGIKASEFTKEEVAKRSASNQQALAILTEYEEFGVPFALFLRNFDIEAGITILPQNHNHHKEYDVPYFINSITTDSGEIESQIFKTLKDRLPVLTLANPADLHLDRTMPRLGVSDEDWITVMDKLVQTALIIFVDCQTLTPGVCVELDAIVKNNREDSTLLIVPKKKPEAQMDSELVVNVIAEENMYKHTTPDKEHELLTSFPRVAYLQEVCWEAPEDCSYLGPLLARAV